MAKVTTKTPKTGISGKVPEAAPVRKKKYAPDHQIEKYGGGGDRPTPKVGVLPQKKVKQKTPNVGRGKYGIGVEPPKEVPKFRKSKYPAGNSKGRASK